MTRPFIPFFAFLVLLLLVVPLSFNFLTSVIPGWQTTIYPPYFLWASIVIVVLLLITIAYWLWLKHVDTFNWVLFTIHFILTITTVIFLKFPLIFLDILPANQDELAKTLSMRLKLIPVAWGLFIAAQMLFFTYYVRAVKKVNV